MNELVQANPSEVPDDAPVEPTLIKANNPSKEEMIALLETVKVNHNFQVDVKAIPFNFKKSKDKDTGLETVRESVDLPIPYPNVNGIVDILEAGGKQLEFLVESIETVVNSAVRGLLTDDFKLNATNFPFDKITWEFLASLPKAQRRGGGIAKETWDAFIEDYITVMPDITGRPIEAVTNMSKILAARLAPAKTNEPVLNLVVEMLALYGGSETAAEHAECVDFLLSKADTYLNVSDADLLANL